MARKSERQTLLESGEARGILRPEHVAELKALRAKQGGGSSGGRPAPKAPDINGLKDANARAAAAGKSLRLYDSVQPAIDRFDGGPLKGPLYDAVMPNEGGGFFDSLGAFAGAPVRAILPDQDKEDYQTINSAKAERIGLRSMEQKGVMAKNDEMQFKAADISASKTAGANRVILDRQRNESHLTKIHSALESKWVARYGSTANPSPNGMTFQQASDFADRDWAAKQAARRQAPPSTRRAQSGWSVTEVK